LTPFFPGGVFPVEAHLRDLLFFMLFFVQGGFSPTISCPPSSSVLFFSSLPIGVPSRSLFYLKIGGKFCPRLWKPQFFSPPPLPSFRNPRFSFVDESLFAGFIVKCCRSPGFAPCFWIRFSPPLPPVFRPLPPPSGRTPFSRPPALIFRPTC